MTRPTKLDDAAIAAWLSSHEGWALQDGALTREHRFADYPTTLGFAVRLGFAAEKRDHHPDMLVHWGKVRVSWSTHDAGGITQLDLELAERTDELARG
jgi:4a-hydroxytetrahydrobiopterin dehydratase